MQSPEGGHVSSQLPAEQSAVHGDEVHDAVQLPDEQEHIPPEQDTGERDEPVPGSGTAGPPLGLGPPPPPPPPPELPQARTRRDARVKKARDLGKWGLLLPMVVPRAAPVQARV